MVRPHPTLPNREGFLLSAGFVDDAFYLVELVGGEAFQVFLAQDGVVDLDVVVLLVYYGTGLLFVCCAGHLEVEFGGLHIASEGVLINVGQQAGGHKLKLLHFGGKIRVPFIFLKMFGNGLPAEAGFFGYGVFGGHQAMFGHEFGDGAADSGMVVFPDVALCAGGDDKVNPV